MPIYKHARKYSLSFYGNNAIINSEKVKELAKSRSLGKSYMKGEE